MAFIWYGMLPVAYNRTIQYICQIGTIGTADLARSLGHGGMGFACIRVFHFSAIAGSGGTTEAGSMSHCRLWVVEGVSACHITDVGLRGWGHAILQALESSMGLAALQSRQLR